MTDHAPLVMGVFLVIVLGVLGALVVASENKAFAASSPLSVSVAGTTVTYSCPTCSTGGSGVTSLNAIAGALNIVSNSSTLSIVNGVFHINIDLNLAHANTWTATQTFSDVIQTLQYGYVSNTGFGTDALEFNAGNNFNSAFGNLALQSVTTGSQNQAFGYLSLNTVTTGQDNSAFGAGALQYTTGSYNSAFGMQSLIADTTGGLNSDFGYNSLITLTTGSQNSAFGMQSLYNLQSGNYNVAIGGDEGFALTTGSNNIFLGYNDGLSNLQTGSNNILIGESLDTPTSSTSNYINIGNVFVLNSNILSLGVNGVFSLSSTGIANTQGFQTFSCSISGGSTSTVCNLAVTEPDTSYYAMCTGTGSGLIGDGISTAATSDTQITLSYAAAGVLGGGANCLVVHQ